MTESTSPPAPVPRSLAVLGRAVAGGLLGAVLAWPFALEAPAQICTVAVHCAARAQLAVLAAGCLAGIMFGIRSPRRLWRACKFAILLAVPLGIAFQVVLGPRTDTGPQFILGGLIGTLVGTVIGVLLPVRQGRAGAP